MGSCSRLSTPRSDADLGAVLADRLERGAAAADLALLRLELLVEALQPLLVGGVERRRRGLGPVVVDAGAGVALEQDRPGRSLRGDEREGQQRAAVLQEGRRRRRRCRRWSRRRRRSRPASRRSGSAGFPGPASSSGRGSRARAAGTCPGGCGARRRSSRCPRGRSRRCCPAGSRSTSVFMIRSTWSSTESSISSRARRRFAIWVELALAQLRQAAKEAGLVADVLLVQALDLLQRAAGERAVVAGRRHVGRVRRVEVDGHEEGLRRRAGAAQPLDRVHGLVPDDVGLVVLGLGVVEAGVGLARRAWSESPPGHGTPPTSGAFSRRR